MDVPNELLLPIEVDITLELSSTFLRLLLLLPPEFTFDVVLKISAGEELTLVAFTLLCKRIVSAVNCVDVLETTDNDTALVKDLLVELLPAIDIMLDLSTEMVMELVDREDCVVSGASVDTLSLIDWESVKD
jgi:hypothetical protein